MNKTRWIVFTVLTLGFLGFLVLSNQGVTIDPSKLDPNKIQVASPENGDIKDHIYGQASSKVIIVNYSNFQCSYCSKFHPDFKAIAEDYKDKITFIFRNFADSHYPNAMAAAASAEAAGLQGKYWPMHDIILESQDEWSKLGIEQRTDMFVSYAKRLDLDIDKFQEDLGSSKINQKIKFDKALGQKHAIKGTPALVLNGVDIDSSNYNDFTKIRQMIDEEIEKAGL